MSPPAAPQQPPVQPFSIEIPEATLRDLGERLAKTRWPDEVRDSGWDYGTNLAYLKNLVAYWRDGFDWRAQERRLNELSHFRTDIGGLGIHFLPRRGHGASPVPPAATPGW